MLSRRVFVLLALDPATGMASRPVGAVGLEGDRHHASLIAHEPAAEGWRERLAGVQAPIAQALEMWLVSGGLSLDLAEVTAPASPELVGSVEAVVDDLLARGGEAP